MDERDAVFRALSDAKRRRALRCLREHRRTSLPDLAELVAEATYGRDVAELSGERVTDLYLSFYHNHLPVLEEAGLVDYQQEADLIAWSDGAADRLARARAAFDPLVDADD